MKRHPVEYLSLISGLTLLAFAITYLVAAAVGGTPGFLVTIPLMMVGIGFAGIAAAVASQQRQSAAAVEFSALGSQPMSQAQSSQEQVPPRRED